MCRNCTRRFLPRLEIRKIERVAYTQETENVHRDMRMEMYVAPRLSLLVLPFGDRSHKLAQGGNRLGM